MIDGKVSTLRTNFASLIGARIARFETAELLHEDGTWSRWDDLPIRISTDAGGIISVSWSRFDDLWIATDLSLPFSIEGSTVRWVADSIEKIKPAVGGTIRAVMLGRGEMTWGEADVEIWTRLLIEIETGWLEIFNALDENGYDFHDQRPTGQLVPCTSSISAGSDDRGGERRP